jgi:hypothetical protein
MIAILLEQSFYQIKFAVRVFAFSETHMADLTMYAHGQMIANLLEQSKTISTKSEN